ncbi:MAG: hypothetical protein RR614_11295, partial [Eubacterium sp.]
MSKQASPQNASAQAAFRPWCVLCVLNPVNRIPDDFKKPSEVHKHSDPCFMAKQSEVLCLEYAKQVRASFKAAPEATPSPSPAPAEPKEDSEMTLSLLVKSINALGFDVGRNSFYAWLKDLGYLKYNFCYQRNLPSQNALDHGFM